MTTVSGYTVTGDCSHLKLSMFPGTGHSQG